MIVKNGLLGIGAIIGVTVVVLLLIMWGFGIGFFSTAVSAKYAKATINYKITSATYNLTNAVQAQQFFESSYHNIMALEANIAVQRNLIKSDANQFNLINLAGIQQECNTAVENYNAASQKVTISTWRPSDLPISINLEGCK